MVVLIVSIVLAQGKSWLLTAAEASSRGFFLYVYRLQSFVITSQYESHVSSSLVLFYNVETHRFSAPTFQALGGPEGRENNSKIISK